jgi:hypothetical protein
MESLSPFLQGSFIPCFMPVYPGAPQSSTGPRTPEGKARTSKNAVSSGLFTQQNCVQPNEREEYQNLWNALWQNLSPIGAMEELFATEIVRGAWRLRRCAMVEATLATYADRENRRRHEERHEQIDGTDVSFRGTCEPTIYDCSRDTQAAVDRARTQAAGTVRRATADLRRLQTERLFRAVALPDNADPAGFGLASFAEVLPDLEDGAKARLIAAVVAVTDGNAATCRVSAINPAPTQIRAIPTTGPRSWKSSNSPPDLQK